MTPSEAEKEFEEWISPIRNKMFIKEDSFYWAKQGYLEAHSRQQEKIEKLKEGINLLIDYIPTGWEIPLGYNQIVNQVKKLLDET